MAKKVKKNGRGKKMIAGALVAAALATTGWWVVGKNKIKVNSYVATEVVDGDTFFTKEKQMIRLASIDAPENGKCGSDEAKKQLAKLIAGKPLYIKILYQDTFKRLDALVYTTDGMVNEQMLRLGWAYYTGAGYPDNHLGQIGREARKNKVGIFSPKCLQDTNRDNPKCVIKGNISQSDDENFYRFPTCGKYVITDVELYLGDAWFCTEAEAKKAGFIKGTDCFGKNWPTSEVVHKI